MSARKQLNRFDRCLLIQRRLARLKGQEEVDFTRHLAQEMGSLAESIDLVTFKEVLAAIRRATIKARSRLAPSAPIRVIRVIRG